MKVCLVEDNNVLNKAIYKKLERNDIECVIFNSISSFHYVDADVYVFDIMLEKKSYDLIKELREKTDKPIMVYTSYSHIEYLNHTYESWADLFIWKVISPNILILKIKGVHRMYQRLKNKQL